MTTTIKLPVFEPNKSKTLTVYWVTFIMIIVVFFGLLIVLKDENNLIGKLFATSLLAFVIVSFFLKKPHSQSGFLIINTNEIKYLTKSKTQIFLTREISEISFIYDGYSGKPVSLNVMYCSSGHSNVLKFKHNNSEIKFYIMLEFRYIGLVRRVFKEFEKVGNPISVINTWGRKIEL